HPSVHLWPHPGTGRATMGAPPVAKLGWVENTKPADRQDFRLGNSNFAEVGLCRSYLSRGHCFNPAPKCQETRNRKAQLRISSLANGRNGTKVSIEHGAAERLVVCRRYLSTT